MEHQNGLGLKVGIEIHQQLDTHKLFCSCPSTIIDGKPDKTVARRLRASAGEEGNIDAAASHEMKKEKEFIYYFYSDANCLVELDEEPPHEINMDAVEIAVQIAKVLNAKINHNVQVMRKTVVDGSNTSGFQRTALIARNGSIDIDRKTIHIQSICLEEEAAKIVERKDGRDIYNLSRLGIPLVEIGTAPDITTPEEAKAVALNLGMILRSCMVKRGLGTIRQDVNVSIRGGARVEIKGAQNLGMIPEIVRLEAMRQKGLLDIAAELAKRKVVNIDTKKIDVTPILEHCESKIISEVLQNGGMVGAVKLEGFSGLIGIEIQPGRRLGTEMADYARHLVKGIFHSDELPKYGITLEEVSKIKKELMCENNDGFVLVSGSPQIVDAALDAVIERVIASIAGVPKEVRKANSDATSSYMRPMPGSSRMYPETDLRPISISEKYIEGIVVPEQLDEKAKRFMKMGLSKELAAMVAKSNMRQWFEKFQESYSNIDAAFIAATILNSKKEILKRFKIQANYSREFFNEVFSSLNAGKISKDAVFEIMVEYAENGKFDISKYIAMDDKALEEAITDVIRQNKGMPFNALIGKVMKQLRGKADGKKITEITKRLSL